MIRAFIAVHLPNEVKEAVCEAQAMLRKSGAGLKWVQPSNMHLTLVFLGDIDEKIVPELSKGLDEIAEKHNDFALAFQSTGVFPNERAAKVFWIGLKEGLAPLTALQKEIAKLAASLGTPLDTKRFHPHITLGRVQGAPSRAVIPEKLRDFNAGEFNVGSVFLLKSQLGGPQPIHTVLHEAKLSPAAEKDA